MLIHVICKSETNHKKLTKFINLKFLYPNNAVYLAFKILFQ